MEEDTLPETQAAKKGAVIFVVEKTDGVLTGGLYVIFVAETAHGKRILRTDSLSAFESLCLVSRARTAGIDAQIVSACGSAKSRYKLADGWQRELDGLSQLPLKMAVQILEPCIH